MHIPIHLDTAEATGAAYKEVLCERCGARYSYTALRDAQGDHASVLPFISPDGHEKALVVAERKLEKALRNAIELVKCPSCGRVQRNMVCAKRRKLYLIALLIMLLAPWPVMMVGIMLFPRSAPTGHLKMFMLFGNLSVFVLGTTVATFLAFRFQPNSGRFFPFSKSYLDKGKLLQAPDGTGGERPN